MNFLKSLLIALLLGLSLTSAGCYLDELAVEPVIVYRVGFGYGYWYNSYWYAAPYGYVYRPGVRPYWGPHYYRGNYGYSHGPYAPRPPYRGGYGGWHHR